MTDERLPHEPIQSADRYERWAREAAAIHGVSLWKDAGRRLRRNRVAVAAAVFLVTLGLFALLTPLLPLQSPILQDPEHRKYLAPNLSPVALQIVSVASDAEQRERLIGERWHDPSWFSQQLIRVRLAVFGDWCVPSLCGTDDLGRDLLARVLWGARVSLSVALVAGVVSLVIGVTYGATAGYFGGWIDSVMMRVVDVLYSVPFIYIVIFLMTFLSEDRVKRFLAERLGIDQITVLYLVIGAIYWLTMARIVRGQVLSLKNEPFIEAARVIGASRPRIIFRHLLPNLAAIVIVYLTLTIPSVMLFESFLSFVGLGVQPPDVSWGQLMDVSVQSITPIRMFWWLILFPGATMTATLFALNFLGDGLRDALDPRLKHR